MNGKSRKFLSQSVFLNPLCPIYHVKIFITLCITHKNKDFTAKTASVKKEVAYLLEINSLLKALQ